MDKHSPSLDFCLCFRRRNFFLIGLQSCCSEVGMLGKEKGTETHQRWDRREKGQFDVVASGTGVAMAPKSLGVGSPYKKDILVPEILCFFPRRAGDGSHPVQCWATWGLPWEAAPSVRLLK